MWSKQKKNKCIRWNENRGKKEYEVRLRKGRQYSMLEIDWCSWKVETELKNFLKNEKIDEKKCEHLTENKSKIIITKENCNRFEKK